MFNKTKFDALPAKLRAIIENAVEAASQDLRLEGDRPLLEGLRRAADQGQGQVLQDARLRCCRRSSQTYDAAIAKTAKDNAMFKEIDDSQKAFAERVVKWDLDNNVQPSHGL